MSRKPPARGTGVPPIAAQHRPVRHHHGAFDEVVQFANIAGPVVPLQRVHHMRGDTADLFVHARRENADEMTHQGLDVVHAVPQRRQQDREYVETIIEVGAERPLGDPLCQALVGRCDNPHVDADGLRTAEPFELLLLQRAQKLSGIAIDLDADLSADAKLKLAARRDTVQVRTTTPMVQTENATMGLVLDAREIEGLPLVTRNPFDLAFLAPGVSQAIGTT